MALKQRHSEPFLQGRGSQFCRGCLGKNIFSGIDLGLLPIANELLRNKNEKIDKFPLHLSICADCGLGQVADVVLPSRIFRDYRYLSSISSTFLNHASQFVDELIRMNDLGPNDWILEIASNDGYLLKNFIKYKIKTIGVEPAANVSAISKSIGVHTISEFFTSSLAIELFKEHGYPRNIIANNVLAHVPDLIDFFNGLSILCGPDTQISIENPSISNILLGKQFDTIYHEHYSYLSATAMRNLSGIHGLTLFNVEKLSIHGGSNRYWLRKEANKVKIYGSVESIIQFELESHLFDFESWKNFPNEVREMQDNFSDWLNKAKNENRIVFGYGAAAKASTILNSMNISPGLIAAIADASLEKQARFMPPNGIDIISPLDLFNQKLTDVIIFPWNIKNEISEYLISGLGENCQLWTVIPNIHEVTKL